MAFNKDELNNAYANAVKEEEITEMYNKLNQASNILIDSIDTEEFEDWLQATLKEILDNGKIPGIGYGIKLDSKDADNIHMYIGSSEGHVYKNAYAGPFADDSNQLAFYKAFDIWGTDFAEKFVQTFMLKLISLDLFVYPKPSTFDNRNENIALDCGVWFIIKLDD